MRQLTSPLEHKQCFFDLVDRLVANLNTLHLERLKLHLAVDTFKLITLKNVLQLDQLGNSVSFLRQILLFDVSSRLCQHALQCFARQLKQLRHLSRRL